ncbi:hypothetical protein HK405_000890 [Cladochytrium tenue]|nr:hypothetical protein HK405_000890 [Cladochytrium tenue]
MKPGRRVNVAKAALALQRLDDQHHGSQPGATVNNPEAAEAAGTEAPVDGSGDLWRSGGEALLRSSRWEAAACSTLALRLARGVCTTSVGSRAVVALPDPAGGGGILGPASGVPSQTASELRARAAGFRPSADIAEGATDVEAEGIAATESAAAVFQLVESAYVHMRLGKRDQSVVIMGDGRCMEAAGLAELTLRHLGNISGGTNPADSRSVANQAARARRFLGLLLGESLYVGSSNNLPESPGPVQRLGGAISIECQMYGGGFPSAIADTGGPGTMTGFKTVVSVLPSETFVVPGAATRTPRLAFFLALLAGADEEERRGLMLGTCEPGHFVYTGGHTGHRNGAVGAAVSWRGRPPRLRPSDAAAFHAWLADGHELGFRQRQLRALKRILAATLHLGNVHFTALSGEADGGGGAGGNSTAGSTTGGIRRGTAGTARIVDMAPVEAAAELMRLEAGELESLLLFGRMGGSRDGTVDALVGAATVVLDARACAHRRDALVAAVHERAIRWAVDRLNARFCRPEGRGWSHFVSVTELPGTLLAQLDTSKSGGVSRRGLSALAPSATLGTKITSLGGLLRAHLSLAATDFCVRQIVGESETLYRDEGLEEEAAGSFGNAVGTAESNLNAVGEFFDFLDKLTRSRTPISTRESSELLHHYRSAFEPDDVSAHSWGPAVGAVPIAEALIQRNTDDGQGVLVELLRLVRLHSRGKTALHLLEILDFDDGTLMNADRDRDDNDDLNTLIVGDSGGALKDLGGRPGTASATAGPRDGEDLDGIPTRVSRIVAELEDLFDALRDTSTWFVLAPRSTGADGTGLDAHTLLREVQALRVRELAASRGSVDTASFSHAEFLARYAPCFRDDAEFGAAGGGGGDGGAGGGSARLVRAALAGFVGGDSGDDARVGRSRVFFREGLWRELEVRLREVDPGSGGGGVESGAGGTESTGMDLGLDVMSDAGGGDGESIASDMSKLGRARAARDTEELRAAAAQANRPADRPVSKNRRRWLCVTWSLTWWIPTCALRNCCKMKRRDVQTAWREKVAGEIEAKASLARPYVILYGQYYLIGDIVTDHVNTNGYLSSGALVATTLGQDVSAMFYKTTVWSNYCPLAQPSGFDNIQRVIPTDANKVWYAHEGKNSSNQPIDYVARVSGFARGPVARDPAWMAAFLASDVDARLLRVGSRLYDVTTYSTYGATFLGSQVQTVLDGGAGKTAIDVSAELARAPAAAMRCLDGLFFVGVVDSRNGVRCAIANGILLGATVVMCFVIGIKFLAALQFSFRRQPEQHDRYVICQVPCYTEGAASLKRTFESLLETTYTDSRKLLFVIADGLIVGSGNDTSTPRIALDLLGVPTYVNPRPVAYEAVGEGSRRLNYAKVYSGHYTKLGKSMPFVVVVKTGAPSEQFRPGNRGKRDSQLILMRFLSSTHYGLPMDPLELELSYHLRHVLGLDPSWFEFLLCVDADTEIEKDSINRLVSSLVRDSKMIGVCGETMVGNEMESWVTMIQVYEYFVSHHLSKAFENIFGCVTCLPGCFSMFRVRAVGTGAALLASRVVVREFSRTRVDTLHLKNLLQLGEDRYLTTVLMRSFPDGRLGFSADARCRTQAPAQWGVLLSQRRRWINSTVHTLYEVAKLKQSCGCCILSLRALVLMDLFTTLAQPSGMAYIAYLIYSIVSDQDFGIPLVALVMIAAVYGGQVVIFMLRGQFQHIGWMVMYILATPIYTMILPLYAFWHFDDFSWGNTRVVLVEGGSDGSSARVYEKDEGEFDATMVPRRLWAEHEQALREQGRLSVATGQGAGAGSSVALMRPGLTSESG